MAIKKFRPITPARRFMSVMDTSDITSKPTVRSLLVRVKAAAGRNNNGRITSRHKEAGAKKLYRLIDFKRNKFGVEGTVSTIEYDPYRNCRICLITYADGDKRYILQPSGLKVGDKVQKDEIIYEITTDKVDTEIPSPADGILVEIRVKEHETVNVDTVVAIIETDSENAVIVEESSVSNIKNQEIQKSSGGLRDLQFQKSIVNAFLIMAVYSRFLKVNLTFLHLPDFN